MQLYTEYELNRTIRTGATDIIFINTSFHTFSLIIWCVHYR